MVLDTKESFKMDNVTDKECTRYETHKRPKEKETVDPKVNVSNLLPFFADPAIIVVMHWYVFWNQHLHARIPMFSFCCWIQFADGSVYSGTWKHDLYDGIGYVCCLSHKWYNIGCF